MPGVAGEWTAMKLRIPAFLFILIVSLASHAASSDELDQDATAALKALYASSPAARALGARAKGVLVLPDVRQSSLVVGGEAGDGVMFRDGKVDGHYSIGDPQARLEAGAASYSYALFFMSDAALDGLRDSTGFDPAHDPDIVFVNIGEANEVSAVTVQPDVYDDAFRETGLQLER
jgi:lipid-binding SYLF domain-containing protein